MSSPRSCGWHWPDLRSTVVIAAVLFGWLQASGAWQSVEPISVTTGAFVERVMIANLFLAIFNLLLTGSQQDFPVVAERPRRRHADLKRSREGARAQRNNRSGH